MLTLPPPVVESVEPAPVTTMVEAVVFGEDAVKIASPPACTVKRRARIEREDRPPTSRVSWPPLSVRLPFALKVPPAIAIVPVAFTVVSPVPLLKVPLLCTLSVPLLALAAPMVAVAAPVSVSAEPAPGDRDRAAVRIRIRCRDFRPVPVTAAPLWMCSVPLLASTRNHSTPIAPKRSRAAVAEGDAARVSAEPEHQRCRRSSSSPRHRPSPCHFQYVPTLIGAAPEETSAAGKDVERAAAIHRRG